jgi:hypothetical protein
MHAFNALKIKNPVRFCTGFLVVDKVIEISNLELIRDLLIFTNLYPTDNLPNGNLPIGKGIQMTK